MRYEHGGDIYSEPCRLDFSSNMNPFGTSQAVARAVKESVGHLAAYPDSQCRKLRAAISERLRIPPEWILAGNGAADLIFSLVLAAKPSKGMVVAPGFAEYEQALRSVGCRVMVFERRQEEGFQVGREFLARLEEELKQGLELLFLASPDNPTGRVIPRDILIKSLELCGRYGARLAVDESFYEFAFREEQETMLPEISREKGLFLIRSFTKMYGIPGLRLGYSVCSDLELREEIERVRQPWSVSIPAQEAGIAALGLSGWKERVKSYVDEQRGKLNEQLRQLGFWVCPSEANYILFYSPRELKKPLSERGILIRDCRNYRGLSSGYYRIAVRREEENRQLMQALAEICRED